MLMPGHTFLYSPPVNKVKRADRRRRARRGLLRHVVAHEPRQVPARRRHLRPRAARPLDPAVLARRAGRRRSRASARSIFQDGVPETAFLTLTFASGATANVQISWLAPRKVREMIDRRQPAHGPVRRHGRRRGRPRLRPRHGVRARRRTSASTSSRYRSGDIVVPRLEPAEPLSLELADFAQRDPHRRASRARTPSSASRSSLAIEAAEESLRRNGEPVAVAARAAARRRLIHRTPSSQYPAGPQGLGRSRFRAHAKSRRRLRKSSCSGCVLRMRVSTGSA